MLRIRELRLENNLTQKELAEKIISESTSDADEVDMQMTPTEVKFFQLLNRLSCQSFR